MFEPFATCRNGSAAVMATRYGDVRTAFAPGRRVG